MRGWQGAPAQPHATTVDALFTARAAAHPERAAAVCAGREASYGELDALSDRLAARLARLGVRHGDTVAVLMDRSVELIAATLGVLKAGAAYLPLDAAAPPARSTAIVAEAGAAVLITDAGSAPDLGVRHTLRVDDSNDNSGDGKGGDGGTAPDRAAAHPDGLAYVMYTSGSTGTPKGVAVSHREVVALAVDRRWRGGAHERVLFRSPHAFDASTYELWVPLLNGGLVVIAPPGDLDVPALAALMQEQRVTGTFLTATLFNELADRCPERLGTLVEVMTGGEAASPPPSGGSASTAPAPPSPTRTGRPRRPPSPPRSPWRPGRRSRTGRCPSAAPWTAPACTSSTTGSPRCRPV